MGRLNEVAPRPPALARVSCSFPRDLARLAVGRGVSWVCAWQKSPRFSSRDYIYVCPLNERSVMCGSGPVAMRLHLTLPAFILFNSPRESPVATDTLTAKLRRMLHARRFSRAKVKLVALEIAALSSPGLCPKLCNRAEEWLHGYSQSWVEFSPTHKKK